MSHRSNTSKRKSSRSLREEDSHSRMRHKHKSREIESKTPPLPRRSSIEELIKKRDSLKNELKVISTHSIFEHGSKREASREEKSRSLSDLTTKKSIDTQSRKRLSDHNISSSLEKKRKSTVSTSLENNGDCQIESEDEEEIIERRRQQRKELLQKLNASQEDKYEKRENDEHENDTFPDKICEAKADIVKDEKQQTTTDMFAEVDDTLKDSCDNVTQDNIDKNAQLNDNWDDIEGYYTVRVGDEINKNRYVIKSILGQGVFANVVKAHDKTKDREVAIKIVRNNDLMYRTGLKEITLLKTISDADPDDRYHCVKYLDYFIHKNHLCMVLESLFMDLRAVLKKYGRNHGINMKALTSYSRQLLVALRHLKKLNIIHADIKPDNILINEKKNVLKLCDFGSASTADDNEATPYLVSRFYRAPEIILGIPYKYSVDIWSAACTMYEMATGKILFTGNSNNKMLKCFMDLKGKMPAKLIRKGKFKDQHFNYVNNFLLHKKDEFSGREKLVEIPNVTVSRDLLKELRKSCKNLTENEDKKLVQLKDILDKMLALDLNHRLTVSDCLRHPFVQEEFRK